MACRDCAAAHPPRHRTARLHELHSTTHEQSWAKNQWRHLAYVRHCASVRSTLPAANVVDCVSSTQNYRVVVSLLVLSDIWNVICRNLRSVIDEFRRLPKWLFWWLFCCCLLSHRRLRSISIWRHRSRPFDAVKRRYDNAAMAVHNTSQLEHVTVILSERTGWWQPSWISDTSPVGLWRNTALNNRVSGRIRLLDPDLQWIWVQIHLANRMTLDLSNVSRIHFGFEFIANLDPDPIIEYALIVKFWHRTKCNTDTEYNTLAISLMTLTIT